LTFTISVLYVDDESAFLEIGKLYLERTNEFSVTTASSVSAALDRLRSHGIQAIVSDYKMLGIDGIGFLKQVRATDKHIPFILFTGKGREEIAIEAFENGADFYLQKGGAPKPQFAELMSKIKAAVDHRRADAQVAILDRLYSVLSATNRVIVRIHDKKELLNEICRILVDNGGFTMAWAGIVNTENHRIEPVAMAGTVEGYLDTIAISTDDIPCGHGPTGTAFRKRIFNVCNDIENDPKMAPWRKEALERGYRSLAAFPFALDSRNAGVITLYASEPGFFSDRIIRLLDEQSGDISFALVTMEHEEQRIAAENDLKRSELQYRRLFETAQDAILIIDGDTGKIIDANKFILDMLGYPLEYFAGKHLWELGFLKDRSLSEKAFAELEIDGYIRYDDLPLETKQGKAISVEFVSNVYLVGDKRIIQCNIRDITRQKTEAEDHCRLAAIVEFSEDAIIGKTLEGIIVSWNTGAQTIYGYTAEEAVGKPISILVPSGEPDETPLILEKIRAGELIRHMETKRRTKDGRIIYVSLTVSPIKNKAGLILGASTIARDITERKRVMDEIEMERDEWECTYNAIADLIAIIDNTFRIVRVNKAMADRLGVSPEAAVGRTCYELVHHTPGPLNICPHQLLLADGKAHAADIHEDSLNGDFFLSVSPIRDHSGKVTGSVHILHDITERKRMEDAVRESEERVRAIIEQFPLSIEVMSPDGRTVQVNHAFEKLWGVTLEDLKDYNILHDEQITRLGIMPLIKKGFSGEAVTFPPVQYDGSKTLGFGGKKWVQGNIYPVRNAAGSIRNVILVQEDITERKHVEEALKASEELFRLSIDKAPEAIFLFDVTENRYVKVNAMAEHLFGCSNQQLLDSGPQQFYKPDQHGGPLIRETVEDHRQHALAGETTEFVQHIGNTRGEDLVMEVRLVLLQSGDRRLIRSSFIDITERKHAEDALALASKKLNLLASITRHDLNNQLMALNAYIELSKGAVDNPVELKDYFDKEQKIADAIASQISFTKDYENLGVQAPIWQNVTAIFRTVIARLPMRNIRVDAEDPDLELFADSLLEKVFYNLVDNALRYGGEQMTVIRVTSKKENGVLVVVVEDDGNGVSPGDKKQLFNKGFGKHTGLGLFLSREILLLTGITITENGEPGKGARFEITVPNGAYRFTGIS
jgi:PAS domain S-box-containing protein